MKKLTLFDFQATKAGKFFHFTYQNSSGIGHDMRTMSLYIEQVEHKKFVVNLFINHEREGIGRTAYSFNDALETANKMYEYYLTQNDE